MADVFLSYKREERAKVERLAAALRGLGLNVWFDASLSAGEAFSDEIDREVRTAKVVLVCWSPEAATSQWVKAEAQVGFTKHNLISTLVAGDQLFEPPVPFNGLHTEDMRSWSERPSSRSAAWLSVLRRLGGLLGRADIAEWGALGSGATVKQIEAWIEAHGATSPLFIDAESFLREREGAEREREAEEAVARERLERLKAEKTAAEAAAREREERLKAEARAAESAARQARQQADANARVRRAEELAATAKADAANARSNLTRRMMLFGATGVGVVGAGYFLLPALKVQFPLPGARSPSNGGTLGGAGGVSFARPAFRLDGPAGELVFASNGRRLAITGNEQFQPLRLVEPRSGTVVASLREPSWYGIARAEFNRDGSLLLAKADTAVLWNANDGSRVASFPQNTSFCADGTSLVSSDQATIAVWDASNGQPTHSIEFGESQRVVVLGPSGRFALVSNGPSATILALAGSDSVTLLNGHQDTITTAMFSADASRVLTASVDRTVRVWDLATGDQLSILDHSGVVVHATFVPGSNDRIATLCTDARVRIWDTITSRQIAEVGADRASDVRITFSNTGNRMIVEGIGEEVGPQLFDGDGNEIATLTGHAARFSEYGTRALTNSFERVAWVWETDTGRTVATLSPGAGNTLWSAAISPSGDQVALSDRESVTLWDVA